MCVTANVVTVNYVEGTGSGGSSGPVGPNDFLVINEFADLGASEVYIGEENKRILGLDVCASKNQVQWQGLDIALNGNIAPSDILAIKIFRTNDNSSYELDDARIISSGVDRFYLRAGNILKANIIFPNSEVVSTINSKYVVAIDFRENAVLNRSFEFEITASANFHLVSGNAVEYGAFPIETAAVTVISAPDRLFFQAYQPIELIEHDLIPYARQEGRDVLIGAFRLRTEDNVVFWKSLRFILEGSLPIEEIKRIKIYKDGINSEGNDDLFDPAKDELVGAIDYNYMGDYGYFMSKVVQINLSQNQRLGSDIAKGQAYFIACDLTREVPLAATMNLLIPTANYLSLVDDTNEVILDQEPYVGPMVTVNRYLAQLTVVPSEIATMSMYQDSQNNLFASFGASVDYDEATLNAIAFNITGTCNVLDNITLKVVADTNNDQRVDLATDMIVGQALVPSSQAVLTVNFTTPARFDTNLATLYVLFDVPSEATVGNTIGLSLSAANF
ncbi:MAG: hypothetical protein OMM_12101, partial [Candidatus Magnetoglobus multicellularis str. Araruama]